MKQKIVAPFAESQVKQITMMQMDRNAETLTCSTHTKQRLHVKKEGLYCPLCDYSQNWAYDPFLYYTLFKNLKNKRSPYLVYIKKVARENVPCSKCGKHIYKNEMFLLKQERTASGEKSEKPICFDCWPDIRLSLKEQKEIEEMNLKKIHILPEELKKLIEGEK